MKKESNDKEKKDDNADGDDDDSDDSDDLFNEKKAGGDEDEDAIKLKVENTTTKQSESGMNRNDYHGDSLKNDVRKTSSLDDRKELTGRYENTGTNNQNANQGNNQAGL